ncbi:MULTISPECIES: peptidoglycan-binding domain-containing protein [unclassified Guyparkeria]|uniref:peptidoglycan-binding domain-containing protein n=1 Tax=unclassified Guyparkeria TaxID=2626246 RepID=UPI000ADD3EAB|nr:MULTISPECIES: peptidoglycan-binding domain-containing protein [unclassified Guyparkeria]
MIFKTVALSLILFGSIGPASAGYNEAMQHFEQQRYQQALQEFREAARSDDSYAQYMLGRLYEAGNGTTQDFVQAHQWYNLAAARGHRHAAEARDALAERMTSSQVARAQQAARDWQSNQGTGASQPDVHSLSDQEVVAGTQRELNRLGYDAGPTDGIMGHQTRDAIYEYQADMGMAQNGRPSADLLKRLRETKEEEVASASPRVTLRDDFSDGDFRRNPPWTVLSGDFEVDQNGLRSIVEADRRSRDLNSDNPGDIGLAVLGMILDQQTNTRQEAAPRPVEPAQIFVNAPVDNAFQMELELASRQRSGSVSLGLFQGNRPDGTGYRLVYSADSQPALTLVRLISGNAEVVARHDGRLDLEDGRFHRIAWSRDENGRMQVHVDNRHLLSARDTGLRDPFQGFVMTNHGGDYTLGRVRLEE